MALFIRSLKSCPKQYLQKSIIREDPIIEEKRVSYYDENIKIAGKTGTAENFVKVNGEKKQLTDHSIFIAFAPKDDPKIALAVYVENGYWGSRWAAPIASLIIEKYLNRNIKRKWIEDRMINGSLLEEYEKPYLGKPFVINE